MRPRPVDGFQAVIASLGQVEAERDWYSQSPSNRCRSYRRSLATTTDRLKIFECYGRVSPESDWAYDVTLMLPQKRSASDVPPEVRAEIRALIDRLRQAILAQPGEMTVAIYEMYGVLAPLLGKVLVGLALVLLNGGHGHSPSRWLPPLALVPLGHRQLHLRRPRLLQPVPRRHALPSRAATSRG
jgi:hypothetical protein